VLKRVALTFVTIGLLLLSFVAYQLWGTALYEHNAQAQLSQELEKKLHVPSTTVPSTPTSTSASTPTTSPPVLVDHVAPTTPDPGLGTPIGFLTIPRIGMSNAAIIEGTGEAQLQQGPGHYQGTPLPGQAGNAAIAGHRTTYAAPFYNLNELQPGDPITVQTTQGIFTYQVVTSHVVLPSNVTVLDASTTPELTLTTCNPRYSAATRLVVVATLEKALTPQSIPVSTNPTTTTTVVGKSPAHPLTLAGGGELSGPTTRSQVEEAILWGALTLVAAVIGLVAWMRGRRPWTWAVLALGAPLTVGGLLLCFQHISLALPQSF
jgi:sortase A